jgi:hypothetical protein
LTTDAWEIAHIRGIVALISDIGLARTGREGQHGGTVGRMSKRDTARLMDVRTRNASFWIIFWTKPLSLERDKGAGIEWMMG